MSRKDDRSDIYTAQTVERSDIYTASTARATADRSDIYTASKATARGTERSDIYTPDESRVRRDPPDTRVASVRHATKQTLSTRDDPKEARLPSGRIIDAKNTLRSHSVIVPDAVVSDHSAVAASVSPSRTTHSSGGSGGKRDSLDNDNDWDLATQIKRAAAQKNGTSVASRTTVRTITEATPVFSVAAPAPNPQFVTAILENAPSEPVPTEPVSMEPAPPVADEETGAKPADVLRNASLMEILHAKCQQYGVRTVTLACVALLIIIILVVVVVVLSSGNSSSDVSRSVDNGPTLAPAVAVAPVKVTEAPVVTVAPVNDTEAPIVTVAPFVSLSTSPPTASPPSPPPVAPPTPTPVPPPTPPPVTPPTPNPILDPTPAPSPWLVIRAIAITEYINSVKLSPGAFSVPASALSASEGTAEERALSWLIFEDSLELLPDTEDGQFRLRQRYALATLTQQLSLYGRARFGFDAEDECEWSLVTCSVAALSTEPLRAVTEVAHGSILGSEDDDLSATIPPDFGLLTSLTSFKLLFADMRGTLPSSIVAWTNLESLDLAGNELTGSLPRLIGAWTNLEEFNVYINKLTGMLPGSIGAWTNLREFSVNENLLSGTIPDSVASWTDLESGGFVENLFTGTMPLCTSPFISYDYLAADCEEGQVKVACSCCTQCGFLPFGTEAPVTEAPVTEAPGTEAPVTDAPGTDAPETEPPRTIATLTGTRPPGRNRMLRHVIGGDSSWDVFARTMSRAKGWRVGRD